ncbi:MAG: hypothetical protein ACR2L1_09815, partial [Pyrinomonadaceae bacterium]
QVAAGNAEMLDLAMMLPDSDIVVTMDINRTLNIAAPSLLGQDAVKIGHLKNLLNTVENQIGINPYEIKQIAAGVKLPTGESKDLFEDSEFAAIIRTENPNGNLLDNWSKRIDVIMEFKDEQAPSRKYIEDFRRFRDFKFIAAAPEKIAETTADFQSALTKIQEINKTLDALPNLTTGAAAVGDLKAKNLVLAAAISKALSILKADTDTKSVREMTIKILNRWNAVTVDDPQKSAKLAAILKESKAIYPVYKKKNDNAGQIEMFFNMLENAPEAEQGDMNGGASAALNPGLDKVIESLGNLPATKVKRTAELNSLAESVGSLNGNLEMNLESISSAAETETENIKMLTPAKTNSKTFYQSIKEAQSEENINGKRMIVIDLDKLDEQPPMTAEKSATEKEAPKKKAPKIGIGFMDEKTMIIGFEKTTRNILNRDANYKNQKTAQMLDSAQNSLFAFALNSNVAQKILLESSKITGKNAVAEVPGDVVFTNFFKDVNLYGSVNYDEARGTTNDITMSVGVFKTSVEELLPPDQSKSPNLDTTFEIAGYQVGKDIFYDLLNSFKAMQASMTFKFEKKKVAALIRNAPRIIDGFTAKNNTVPKPKDAKSSKTQPRKLESFQDLLTAPQLYLDLASLLRDKS